VNAHFDARADVRRAHPATADGGYLRHLRERRALTPRDLGERLGVHPASVLRWERRERLPGPRHLHDLALALEVRTGEVVAFFDAARPVAVPPARVRGTGLRALRRRAGVSVATIGGHLRVPAATVYNWEAGRVGVPREHLPRLAVLLEVEVALLPAALRGAGERPPPAPSPLRRLRRRTGLSQQQVADRLGVSRQTVSAWERGLAPPLVALRRLSGVYGVPVARVARAAGVTPPALLDRRRWQAGDLAPVLRSLRAWSGLTQRELARRSGCSPTAVMAWEAGRSVPRAPAREALERLYGLPCGSLLAAVPRGPGEPAERVRPGRS